MTKIKLNNFEVDKAELVKLYKEKPELFKDDEKPLGDDFSMLEYLRVLKKTVEDALGGVSWKYYQEYNMTVVRKRLNALIKIWDWKEENDHKIGSDWHTVFDMTEGRFEVLGSNATYTNAEIPRFSSFKIAERALTELEQEYKIVFNVK